MECFAATLDLLRGASVYHLKKKNLTENYHFRASFSLWFKALLDIITWCATNECTLVIE